MSVDGVWKVEMLSPYGWEQVATAFLQKGRYRAASANHYSIGRYEADGETIKVEARITQYGKKRTVFGKKKKHVDTRMVGNFERADEIVGTASSAGAEDFDVRVRMTRLGGLD